MRRRFEFKGEKSAKFWEVRLEGKELVVNFGRLGTVGQEQRQEFGSAALASAKAKKLVQSKIKKGYAEVGLTRRDKHGSGSARRKGADDVVTRIATLVTEIVELRNALGTTDMALGRPATPEKVHKAEREAHFEFPPSYRAFLALHNGWLNFWPDWSLLGVGGSMTKEMKRDVQRSLRLARNAVENDAHIDGCDPAKAWADLERKEFRNREVIHPLRHPVFGTSFNGGLLLFDRNRIHGGEPEVVAVRNGQFLERWKSFEYFLLAARDDLRQEHRAKPDAKRGSGCRTEARGLNVKTPRVLPIEKTKYSVKNAKLHLVSASADSTLVIWDIATRRAERTLRGHARTRYGVLGVRAAPTEALLVSWASDRTIRLWDPRVGKELGILATAAERVDGVAFHPREPLVAGILDFKIMIFDLREGNLVLQIPESRSAAGVLGRASLGFSWDGSEIVSISDSGVMEVFDASNGKRGRSWRIAQAEAEVYDVDHLRWSPDGKLVGATYEAQVWLKPWKGNGSPRHILIDSGVYDFSWSPCSKYIAVAEDGGIQKWTIDGKLSWRSTLKRTDGSPVAIAYAPDGQLIAEAGSAKVIRLRSADSGDVVATLKGHDRAVNGLDFVAF